MQSNKDTKLPRQYKIITDAEACSNPNNLISKLSNNALLISSDEIISSENISNVDKEMLIEKNKTYFLEYKKQKNKNELLKLKLQELIKKKNKYKKCLNKLEQNKNDVVGNKKKGK